ncbi:MAG: hypothetical protein AUG51_15815 [Acidobacteria bacterium 13_1_20CM_3_53_8]|nr:MAG: hypothetical protein AUG51_15815 [Acidobacteria bacterium 13_1_20CM_3_53_8]
MPSATWEAWNEKHKNDPDFKIRRRDATRRYRARHPDRNKLIQKSANLVTKFKIDLFAFREMVEARQGKCDICGRYEGESLCVDHNHKNDKIRGLLCSNCNHAIGLFEDDPNRVSSAVNYLCRNYNGAKDKVLENWPNIQRRSIFEKNGDEEHFE